MEDAIAEADAEEADERGVALLGVRQRLRKQLIEGALLGDDPGRKPGDLADRAFVPPDCERMAKGLRKSRLAQQETKKTGHETEEPYVFRRPLHRYSLSFPAVHADLHAKGRRRSPGSPFACRNCRPAKDWRRMLPTISSLPGH